MKESNLTFIMLFYRIQLFEIHRIDQVQNLIVS